MSERLPPLSITKIPRRFGPYEIVSRLGGAGGGVVYRARHAETGQAFAVKTVDASGVTDLEALRRETHALSQIRHPGVVRVYAQGVHEGTAWYAMEFIEGLTLERACAGFDGLGSGWLASLPIARSLCAILAYVHGEGIVHRDLKPGNVIVRKGRPVLVDFGFASRFIAPVSREALEAGGEILGTFAYMSPEQARGEYVDARADLYALGCILYELITGRPPFIGPGWEVLEQHLVARPVPPSVRNPTVPPEIEALVCRLLEKDPRKRPGYASDVATALAKFVAVPADEGAPAPRVYIYRPAFAGRADLVSRIDGFLAEVLRGTGRCALIQGESGIGKTRFAMEITRCAMLRGLTVVTGDCVPAEGTPGTAQARTLRLHPLRPLLQAIYTHCHEGGLEVAERVLGPRGKTLAMYEPSLTKLAGQDRYPEVVPLPAAANRSRLLADLAVTIERFAREHPLLLVLDDLQWADELTLALLRSLNDTFYRRTPILVVATLRSEEMNSTLREIIRMPHVVGLELARMTQAEVGSMVSDMLALREPPRALVGFVSHAAEGNPFFVAEYLRAAVNCGLLTRDSAAQWQLGAIAGESSDSRLREALALPHTLRELVSRRLAELGPHAQLCLEGAAVMGREFDGPLLDEIVQMSDRQRMEAIHQLLARCVIEEQPGGGFRFAHDKLREVAYERVPNQRRRLLHERAAEIIESHHAGAADFADFFGSLARHWEMAGAEVKALDYLEKAGKHALRAGAHREAREWFSQAIALDRRCSTGPSSFRQACWHRMLGEAYIGAGELEAAVEHTSSALAGLGFPVPHTNLGWYGLLARQVARQTVHRLTPIRLRPRERTVRERTFEAALASGQLATAFYFRSHLLGAVSHSLRCVNLAEVVDQPAVAALSYAQLGYISGAIRLRSLAERYFERAGASREDATTFAAGLYFHAMYEMGLANWSQSERLGREALDLLERIQNRQEAEVARTIVANTLYFRGRFRDAQALAQAMLASAESRSNTQHTGWGAFLTGRSLLALGHLSEACRLLDRGHEVLVPLSDFVSLIMCEGLLARALLLNGRSGEALEVANLLMARLRASGTLRLAQCLDGYSSLAEVYLGLWRTQAAPDVREVRRSAHWSCLELRRFARPFPMAVPSALRTTAWEHWLSGQPTRAIRAWRRAIHVAASIQMKYDEARAHQDLSLALLPDAKSEFHRVQANRLFAELGCAPPVSGFSATA